MMTVEKHFVVSYDLHNQGNCQPVWEYLEKLGGARLLESVWVVSGYFSATQVRDDLKTVMDPKDSAAVVELKPGSVWATQKVRDDGAAWLHRNILR
ncbi:MAG: hypothetical protein V4601_07405 [Pseudomonadota bacterium]